MPHLEKFCPCWPVLQGLTWSLLAQMGKGKELDGPLVTLDIER